MTALEAIATGTAWVTGPAADPTRYRVDPADLDRVEIGGEGLVYRAHDTSSGRTVALKVLTTVSLDEFEQVAARYEMFVRLRHPNLVSQVEVFLGRSLADEQSVPADHAPADDDLDVPYSVSEWIDGRPLAEAAVGAPIGRKLAWITDVAAALTCLHGAQVAAAPRGIVHRDVKPSNVRVDANGHAVLLDLGLARPAGDPDGDECLGTYLWRAPEILGPETDSFPPSATPYGVERDTWALGALAHWLLVGEPPRHDGAAAACERMTRSATRLGDPDAVSRHLAHLLRSAPEQRPADLAHWSAQLTRLARRRRDHASAARLLVGTLLVAATLLLGASASGIPLRRPEPRNSIADGAPATSVTTAVPGSTDGTAGGTGAEQPGSGYLTFADRGIEVIRPNVFVGPRVRRFVGSTDGGHEVTFDVSTGQPFVLASSTLTISGRKTAVGVSNDGVEVTVDFASGGRSWTMTVSNASFDDVDTTELQDAAEAFLGDVRIDDAALTVDPAYREIRNFENDRPRWTIRQRASQLSAYDDTTTSIAGLPGTAATVRDHEARVGRHEVVWRESPTSIIVLTPWNGPDQSIDDRDDFVAEQVAAADRLVPSTEVEYRQLDTNYDQFTAVVVTVPPAVRRFGVSFGLELPDGTTSAVSRPAGSEGAWISRVDTAGASSRQVAVWLTPPGGLRDGSTIPACAHWVPVPAAGMTPLVVPIDVTCTE